MTLSECLSLNFISLAVVKHPDKNSVEEWSFIWLYSSQTQSIIVGQSGQQELEVAGYITPKSRQRMNACVLASAKPLLHFQSPGSRVQTVGMVQPMIRLGFPTSTNMHTG